MTRVMFVDDEPQVLRGIARMLDVADVDWDIETADSCQEALAKMKDDPVDVLVSDMKMPALDGAALLDEVSRAYPATVRIVLSGQASKDDAYKAISPMHQYLSKPCEADELRDTVARACALREVLDHARSNEVLCGISNLPSLPDVYQKVVAEIESEDGSLVKVGKLIENDPAMTAKILQLANSAIFGVRATITSPAQAASFIGMDSLKSMVLSLSVFKSFDEDPPAGFSIGDLTSHCVRVGSICRHIAKCEKLDDSITSEAFTAGLLHDVGKLVLAAHAPKEMAEAYSAAKTKGIPLVDAEREIMGLGHDGIGGYLLALWGLPQSIVEGVCFHHSIDDCRGTSLTTPAVVYIANLIDTGVENCTSEERARLNELLEEMQLQNRVEAWSDLSAEEEGASDD